MKLKLLFRKLLHKRSDFDLVLIFIGLCPVSHLQSVPNSQNTTGKDSDGCGSECVSSLFWLNED